MNRLKEANAITQDLRNALYKLSDQELIEALRRYPEEVQRLRQCLRNARLACKRKMLNSGSGSTKP